MVKRLYHSSLFLFAFWSGFRFEIASAAALQQSGCLKPYGVSGLMGLGEGAGGVEALASF